ncbi:MULTISPECIES: 5-(carboxyamino)imidazole ribonucleotide synthase [unclassified Arcicella]|uniref:5-(carboxyamino)imidazole ribonucleotide synthase n=1 Tax=unclassified Arcicella TaxID=2644986 RepID=UPI0028645970|nr:MULTISPECIES: 5-(carboxyamino)imidazole ribonucleotide synthase [unclassified Arcicella]MDR6560697.1 5-(carboxyamino)imidazole ribonucleotide synthase [Arcicella sp. BE51]MDR6810581.1 5-(carboxyamino)imidazole ribonucleotide synthase [Arcicella sp. BE140]MDR6821931.1 5-(carboxyamino)imidazole ribonucleotide synthase [Arcicella sp. BE139]
MFSKNFKLGLLGGGQLGRMLLQAAIDLDIHVKALDPDPDAPCAKIAPEFVVGSFLDYDTVYQFGQDCEVITIEIENVNLEALKKLRSEGKKVFPQPEVLEIIQDKRIQKQFYLDNNLPTSAFILTDSVEDISKHLDFLPAFNKLGKGGYDGRGVQKLSSEDDLPLAFTEPSLLEKAIDFDKEIAVIVARNEHGEIKTFPTVECVFHPVYNLVEYLFAPAAVNEHIHEEAKRIAIETAEKLGIVGLLAVEMFLTKDGQILINEVAPRTHNSGHHTIRANHTSQFEQHLRAVLGLPLGDTTAHSKAAMVNLLGEDNYTGEAKYVGMNEALAIAGVYPFLYGKKITKPFRKMGHVTVVDEDLTSLKEKVKAVKETLKVIA